MKINNNNIEWVLFRYKEGMLNATEASEVELALLKNPDWQKLADMYDPTLHLPAYGKLHYDDKEGLKRIATIGAQPLKPKAIPIWPRIAIAATVALLLIAIPTLFRHSDKDGEMLANVTTGKITKTVEPFTSDTVMDKEMPIEAAFKTITQAKTNRKMALTHQKQNDDSATALNTCTTSPSSTTANALMPSTEPIMTNRLIVYRDEISVKNDTGNDKQIINHPPSHRIEETNQLIAYRNHTSDTEYMAGQEYATTRPEWMYALEDKLNVVRLRSMEWQTELLCQVNKQL